MAKDKKFGHGAGCDQIQNFTLIYGYMHFNDTLRGL